MRDPLGGRLLDDSELVSRTRSGDTSAYGELVTRYQEIALRAAYLVTGSAADAEEAVQEGFVKGYRALGRFRESEPFRPWIMKIVTNEARNIRRSAKRKVDLALRASRAQPRDSGDAAPSPESAVINMESKNRLLRELMGLREVDRLVVAYRYFLELSEAETARALGIRAGTVKSRLSRALARLRESMREELG